MGCLNCGKDLVHTEGKRPKKFCNTSCRSSYGQKQKRAKLGGGKRKPGRPPEKDFKAADKEAYDAPRANPLLQDEIGQFAQPFLIPGGLGDVNVGGTIQPIQQVFYKKDGSITLTIGAKEAKEEIKKRDGISRIKNISKEDLNKQIAEAKERVSAGMAKKPTSVPKEPAEGSNAFYLRYGVFYKKDLPK